MGYNLRPRRDLNPCRCRESQVSRRSGAEANRTETEPHRRETARFRWRPALLLGSLRSAFRTVSEGRFSFAFLFALLAGCTPPTVEEARYSFASVPQACVYTLQAPVQLAGSDPDDPSPDTSCVVPEGGDVFTVGLGWPGGVLQLEALRPVAGLVDLAVVGLYVRTDQDWCVDWRGYATVRDLPDWSVSINASCITAPLQVGGSFHN